MRVLARAALLLLRIIAALMFAGAAGTLAFALTWMMTSGRPAPSPSSARV